MLQINDSLTAYRLASIGDIISIVAREAEPADAEVSQQYILKVVPFENIDRQEKSKFAQIFGMQSEVQRDDEGSQGPDF